MGDLDESGLIEELADTLRGRRPIDLRALAPESLLQPQITVDRLPPGAVAIDLGGGRSPRTIPGALRLEGSRWSDHLDRLERGSTYVVLCEHGQRSLDVAAELRAQGFDAYAYVGDPEALPD